MARLLIPSINVFPIVLPPLRERTEDIPLLADHFLHKYAQEMNRPVKRITPLALDFLLHYQWPGNIRELENEIERAVTLAADGQNIDTVHLSEKIVAESIPRPLPKTPGETLRSYTERIEKSWIIETLGDTHGNRTRAAKILGLTRQGLLKKIARYGISI